MTPVFAARRRAEEFAARVEGSSTAGGDDARYAPLLDLVTAMRATPAPEPRPEFVSALRERLMAEAPAALAAADTSRLALPPRQPRRERRVAAAIGGLALVGATTSMAMAAQSALPGDTLYPIKRAIEDVHTGISVGEGQKGSTMLANAGDRLDEATELSRGGDLGDDQAIADTLGDFTDQASEASDLLLADYSQHGTEASIDKLRDFTATSLGQLTELESLVPEPARDELMHAAQVLITIDTAAQQACPTCGGGGITQIPPVFAASSSQLPTAAPQGSAHHGRRGEHGHRNGSPHLPPVGADALPPGSVLDPGTGGGSTGPSPTDPTKDPITTLTDGITGGGSQPTDDPSLPGLDDTVDDVTDGVGELLDTTGDTLNGTLP
ncbi:DUF5667 domain-containing protein [Nocardioides sp. MAHUQ-72]|uniref:DUF5667 domain-containing protein n=1 Tax=unclassified Nocardioides TaxID=2615069 RepID=UPI0036192406